MSKQNPKVLPTRQYCFNSRVSPITDVSDSKRSTIQCNLDKDAFRIPDDQDCLMSVITAEIPINTITFDKIPQFYIYHPSLGSTIQTFAGIDINTTYTITTLIAALNGTTYTHFGYSMTLAVTRAAGQNYLTFDLTTSGFTGFFISFGTNIPQLGINVAYNNQQGANFPVPYTAPSAPLLISKYYMVKSPDLQTMYNQPIAKIQTDLTYQSTTIYYKNFSNFDIRILSPFVQNFQLQLTDEDGNVVNLRGLDWSINVQFRFLPKQKLEIM